MNKEKYRLKFSMFNNPNKSNVLVYFDNPFGYDNESSYSFVNGEVLLYLGEIQNNQGHCIVANKKGAVIWGYHTENFIEISDEIEDFVIFENGVQKVIFK